MLRPEIAQYRADLASARPCRLEGYTHGQLDGYVRRDSACGGYVAKSHCGKVSIRLSAATVARKYDGESVPSIYYE